MTTWPNAVFWLLDTLAMEQVCVKISKMFHRGLLLSNQSSSIFLIYEGEVQSTWQCIFRFLFTIRYYLQQGRTNDVQMTKPWLFFLRLQNCQQVKLILVIFSYHSRMEFSTLAGWKPWYLCTLQAIGKQLIRQISKVHKYHSFHYEIMLISYNYQTSHP